MKRDLVIRKMVKFLVYFLISDENLITSPLYFAPELFQNDSYRPSQVAVWALGVVLYTLIAGVLPWDSGNLDEQIRCITQGKFSLPRGISSRMSNVPKPSDSVLECQSLMVQMLTVNPSKRATIEHVRNHEWFKLNVSRKGLINKFLQRSKSSREVVKSIPYEKESPKRVSNTDDALRVSKSSFKQEVSTWKPTELIQLELERVLNLLSISFQKNDSSTKYICRDFIRKVKFTIEICRVHGLEGFKGLKMKRKTGSNYDMRAIEENFLSLLKL